MKVYEITTKTKEGKKVYFDMKASMSLVEAQKEATQECYERGLSESEIEITEKGYAVEISHFDDITSSTDSIEDFQENASQGQKAKIDGEWFCKIDSSEDGSGDIIIVKNKNGYWK